MYYLKAEATFDSAHFLYGYDGKCRNLHGHTWRVVAEICADELKNSGQTRGMIIDFSELKSALRGLCDELDHCMIFESGTLKQTTEAALKDENFRMVEVPFRPTAENFAKYFFDKLKKLGLPVSRVEIYETPTNSAAYNEGP